MLIRVKVLSLRKIVDAKSAHMEIDHQNEAGNTGESEIWATGHTASW